MQTLAPWSWLGLPALAAVAATLLLAAPVRVFGFPLPEPVFAVALAFAWAAIRPSMLGPAALLLLGLFDDFLWGGPLGLWPFALVCVYGLTLGGRALMAGQGPVVMAAWYVAGVLCRLRRHRRSRHNRGARTAQYPGRGLAVPLDGGALPRRLVAGRPV